MWGLMRTEELSAGIVHPCRHQTSLNHHMHANGSPVAQPRSVIMRLAAGVATLTGASYHEQCGWPLVRVRRQPSPQLCMTASVRLTTSAVNTCSPVMGHTPPLASVPATAAMILHVACGPNGVFVAAAMIGAQPVMRMQRILH